jgi:hypothetical protein
MTRMMNAHAENSLPKKGKETCQAGVLQSRREVHPSYVSARNRRDMKPAIPTLGSLNENYWSFSQRNGMRGRCYGV